MNISHPSSKKLRWIISSMLLLVLVTSASAVITGRAGEISVVNDLYWITFGGDDRRDPVYVMQIDQQGTVTRPPTPVFNASQVGSEMGAAALRYQPDGDLILWRLGGGIELYRAVIQPLTLNRTSLKNLSTLSSDEDYLQATQRSKKNFLAMEVGQKFKGVGVSSKGSLTGKQWNLMPGAPHESDEACLSSDGRVAVSVREETQTVPPDELYLQLLKKRGRPTGSPKLIATGQDLEACDVSNLLANNTRFVVFMEATRDQIFLQEVDIDGNTIQSPHLLHTSPTRDDDDQIIAVDPLGRFVVFTVGGDPFGCRNKDILAYQELKSTGTAKGQLKILPGCGLVADDIQDIDILLN